MDPLRIVLRAVVAYVVLLVLVRLSGKRTVRQGSAVNFTLALVIGDLVDDAVWGELAMSTFAIAATVLVAVHVTLEWWRARQDSNLWPSAPEADALSS